MARVRNDHGETRVCPTLAYSEVLPGQVVTVRDEDALHWAAGGWTVLDPYPVPQHLMPNHADGLAYAVPAEGVPAEPIDRSVEPPAAVPAEPVPPVAPAEPTGDPS